MQRLLALAASGLFLLAASACAPRQIEVGPPIVQPDLVDSHITAADGTDLPLTVWRPAGKPRAVILALHGFNDYANAFADPAADWAKQGILTYAYDQRGFGRGRDVGLWAGTETLVSDLEMATKLVAKENPGVPLYVLGESMGGAVVLVAGAEHRLPGAAGVILVAPAVRGRETLNMFDRAGLWFFAHTVPWLAGQPGGRPFHFPSDNKEMLRKYSRDPLVIKDTRIDAVWGLVDLMDAALAAAPKFDLPALIQLGGKDDLIPNSPSKLMVQRLPPAPAGYRRVAVYPEGYHMLLRDLHADLPIRDIEFWVLNQHSTAALPSGAERPALVQNLNTAVQ